MTNESEPQKKRPYRRRPRKRIQDKAIQADARDTSDAASVNEKFTLTVTVNPALDQTVRVPGFQAGRDFFKKDQSVSAGGKGLNVSRTLKSLRQPTLAMGIVGGSVGRHIEELLKKESLPFRLIRTREESRLNTTIINTVNGSTTRLMEEGSPVTEGDIQRFLAEYKGHLKRATCVVLSGRNIHRGKQSLYADMIALARNEKVPCLLDTHGEALREGLKAKPWGIKPNRQEAEEILGRKINTLDKLKEAMNDFHKMGIRVVMISLDKHGAVGSNQESMWYVKAPEVKLVNPIGCGDAFVAGFVAGFVNETSFQESLQMAVTCGTANTLSLTPGLISQDNLVQLADRLQVKSLGAPEKTTGTAEPESAPKEKPAEQRPRPRRRRRSGRSGKPRSQTSEDAASKNQTSDSGEKPSGNDDSQKPEIPATPSEE